MDMAAAIELEVPMPPSSHTKLVDTLPLEANLDEVKRPIAKVFLVLDGKGQVVGEPLEDMCAALRLSRKTGEGSAVIRADDGKVLAIVSPTGSTSARIEARGREITEKFLK